MELTISCGPKAESAAHLCCRWSFVVCGPLWNCVILSSRLPAAASCRLWHNATGAGRTWRKGGTRPNGCEGEHRCQDDQTSAHRWGCQRYIGHFNGALKFHTCLSLPRLEVAVFAGRDVKLKTPHSLFCKQPDLSGVTALTMETGTCLLQ